MKYPDYLSFPADGFRSTIRGHVENIDAVPSDASGYQQFVLEELEIFLFPCTSIPDQSKVYFLTHAYEYENLFFLFVYDRSTREMALEAFVEEDVDILHNNRNEEIGDIELSYITQRETFYQNIDERKTFLKFCNAFRGIYHIL